MLVTKPYFLKPWRGPVRGCEGQLWEVFHRRLQPWRPHGLCSQLPVLLQPHIGLTQEKVSFFYHTALSLDLAHFGLSCRHKKVHLVQGVHQIQVNSYHYITSKTRFYKLPAGAQWWQI